MKIAKRVFLFVAVNLLIMVTLSVVLSALGVQPYLDAKGINFQSLIAFCLLWGFGGAFISLALSRQMAKWMMGVEVIGPAERRPEFKELERRVHQHARAVGLRVMPQVGVYESPELNAFATGPTRNRSLVAVSSGLLQRMNAQEIDGVLAHEVAHIANGDMVTMTLVQGVVNAFVMFLARVAGFFVSQFVDEERRSIVQFAVVLVLEILLGILGMLVVAGFSRRREYRADEGGASLAGTASMVAALERLKLESQQSEPLDSDEPALATLKISGKAGGLVSLFATHPHLDDRISRLKELELSPRRVRAKAARVLSRPVG